MKPEAIRAFFMLKNFGYLVLTRGNDMYSLQKSNPTPLPWNNSILS